MNAAATEFNLDFCRQATQDLWQEISIREIISLQDFINWERNGSAIPENTPLALDLDSDSRENSREIEESECSSVGIRGERLVAEKDVETVHEQSQEVSATGEPIQYTTPQHSNEMPSLALDTVQSKLIRKLFPPNLQLKPQTTNQDNNLIEKITALELENNNLKNNLNKCKSERDDLSRKLARLKHDEVEFSNKAQKREAMAREANNLRAEHDSTMKKLKQDKMLWEKQKKTMILPTQKERRELELLKDEMKNMQREYKAKEKRMAMTQERLLRKIADLEKANNDLKLEADTLEAQRFELLSERLSEKRSLNPKKSPISGSKISFPKPPKRMPMSELPKVQAIPLKVKNHMQPTKSKTLKGNNKNTDENVFEFKVLRKDLDNLASEIGLDCTFEVLNIYQEAESQFGEIVRTYNKGTKLLGTLNGSIKVLTPDVEVVYFPNGDSKTISNDGETIYWYQESKTKHKSTPEYEIYEFNNGQVEKKLKDGTLDILFPDGTRKLVQNDCEEIFFANGKYQKVNGNLKIIQHIDGTKEVWEDGVRTKHYTNGIIKTVYPDGKQETIWPDGQTRIKHISGIVQDV